MQERKSKTTLGVLRDAPRVYLVGNWLREYGFEPGSKFQIIFGIKVVTLFLNEHGVPFPDKCRLVSATPKNEPVVQLQSRQLWESFGKRARKLDVATTHGKIVLRRTHDG